MLKNVYAIAFILTATGAWAQQSAPTASPPPKDNRSLIQALSDQRNAAMDGIAQCSAEFNDLQIKYRAVVAELEKLRPPAPSAKK